MAIQIGCPCGQPLLVDEAHVGQAVSCPRCRALVMVPDFRQPTPNQAGPHLPQGNQAPSYPGANPEYPPPGQQNQFPSPPANQTQPPSGTQLPSPAGNQTQPPSGFQNYPPGQNPPNGNYPLPQQSYGPPEAANYPPHPNMPYPPGQYTNPNTATPYPPGQLEPIPHPGDSEEDEEIRKIRRRKEKKKQFRLTNHGLSMIVWGVRLYIGAGTVFLIALTLTSFIAIFTETSAGITGTEVSRQTRESVGGLVILTVIAAILAGLAGFGAVVLSFIGKIFCLNVPPKSGGRLYLILDMAAIGIGTLFFSIGVLFFLGSRSGVGLGILGIGILGVFSSYLFFAIFLRHLAFYVKEKKAGDDIMAFLVFWIGGIVVGSIVYVGCSWLIFNLFEDFRPSAVLFQVVLTDFYFVFWVFMFRQFLEILNTIQGGVINRT